MGARKPGDDTGAINAIDFLVRQRLSKMAGATLVQVKAVNGTGVNPVGFVDVQPLVFQIDGYGNLIPSVMQTNVPYFRLQGGQSAVICDPAIGDIGLCIFARHDLSNVKATRAPAGPGSRRQHSWSDGLYLGGYLNGTPNEYIWLTGSGVKVKTAGTFEVDAAQTVFNCPVQVNGTITATDDVTGNGISLDNHTHTGVQPGSGSTGKPQ